MCVCVCVCEESERTKGGECLDLEMNCNVDKTHVHVQIRVCTCICTCIWSVCEYVLLNGIEPSAACASISTVYVQIILKIIAFRLKYFTHKFEVFDGMVVVVSWVLDIASM